MSKSKLLGILAGKLFDSQERRMLKNQVILIDQDVGIILHVLNLGDFKELHGDDNEIDFLDLGHLTLIPGLVDVHVHCRDPCFFTDRSDIIPTHHVYVLVFLHAYAETPWTDQVTKESLAERTIRATVHAHKTLMAGFTTVR
jgi:hypothetical protein